MADADDPALSFALIVRADLSNWYQSAEAKAQLILTVNGIFVAFLSSLVLRGVNTLYDSLSEFAFETWLLLGAMAACLASSIICAVLALANRGLRADRLAGLYRMHAVDPDIPETVRPEVVMHFYPISGLSNRAFVDRMVSVDTPFATRAIVNDSHVFACFIRAKYRWINRGYILMGATFVFFLMTSADYAVRVATG
ncbi:hypothetical protein NYO98_06695 [Nocardioides sp. STR2]|uniref:Pycsar effector protein domain-containing protein n=1 Tax=Nocardioides pini TaxID=2975053 RepID=A0ABT4CAI3_9ACTN|nr:hypothetical protein [Nocardioides pini]MCY4725960.1 hypothetical protein [Nocardioides pini]